MVKIHSSKMVKRKYSDFTGFQKEIWHLNTFEDKESDSDGKSENDDQIDSHLDDNVRY